MSARTSYCAVWSGVSVIGSINTGFATVLEGQPFTGKLGSWARRETAQPY